MAVDRQYVIGKAGEIHGGLLLAAAQICKANTRRARVLHRSKGVLSLPGEIRDTSGNAEQPRGQDMQRHHFALGRLLREPYDALDNRPGSGVHQPSDCPGMRN